MNHIIKVQVWIDDKHKCSSSIIQFNDNVVVLESGEYLRSNCELSIIDSQLILK
jgi:hypothetical protein